MPWCVRMGQDKIFLQGMVFYAYHGAFAAEKELGQRFIVDVEMDVDLQRAGLSDDLNLTVHYGEVYDLIKKVMTEKKYDLIETVGEKIAQGILDYTPLVQRVRVLLKKPEVPIAGILDYAAIQIVRGR